MSTVKSLTHIEKSTQLKRTINPSNPNEMLILVDGFAFVVNKRAWTLLTINAPVERVMLESEV